MALFGEMRPALAGLPRDACIDVVFQTAGQALLCAASDPEGRSIGDMWMRAGAAFSGRTTFGADEAVWMLEEMSGMLATYPGTPLDVRDLSEAMRPALLAAQGAKGEDLPEVLKKAANAAEGAVNHGNHRENSLTLMLRSLHQAVATRCADLYGSGTCQ